MSRSLCIETENPNHAITQCRQYGLSMLVEDRTTDNTHLDNLVKMTNEDFIAAKLLEFSLAEKLGPWDSERVKYYT